MKVGRILYEDSRTLGVAPPTFKLPLVASEFKSACRQHKAAARHNEVKRSGPYVQFSHRAFRLSLHNN